MSNRPGPEMADPSDEVKRPHDWASCVSVAYLRLTGSSQEEAATMAGVGVRTIGRWEACSWWAEAEAEAGERWLKGLLSDARESLRRHVPDDGKLALSVAERLIPQLNPKTALELTGGAGGPVEIAVTRRIVYPSDDA